MAKRGGANIGIGKAARPSWLLKQYSGLVKEGRALVLSCGGGGDTIYLAEQDFAVTGLDVNQDNLENTYRLAGSRNIEIDLRNTEPLQFKFNKNSYSIIYCDQLLSHLRKSEIADLAARIIYGLRKGGIVLGSGLTTKDPSLKEIRRKQVSEVEKNCFQLSNGWIYSYFDKREILDIFPEMQPVYYSETDYFESELKHASWRGLVEFVFRKI